jgi:hypothetical protein
LCRVNNYPNFFIQPLNFEALKKFESNFPTKRWST